MLRSGLVNQHRARFEEGFPHERNNHPRDALERPYVQDTAYPILKKGEFAKPELPVNAPNPIQSKYIDIFGKETTPDQRMFLYREFFRAARKFGAIPGQPTAPQNSNRGPGNMPPPPPPAGGVPPNPPPGDQPGGGNQPGGPGGGNQQPPPGPGGPGAPSSSGPSGATSFYTPDDQSLSTQTGTDYYSQMAAQVFMDSVGGNIGGRGYDHSSQVDANEEWLADQVLRKHADRFPSLLRTGRRNRERGFTGPEMSESILFNTMAPLGQVVGGNVTSAAANAIGIPIKQSVTIGTQFDGTTTEMAALKAALAQYQGIGLSPDEFARLGGWMQTHKELVGEAVQLREEKAGLVGQANEFVAQNYKELLQKGLVMKTEMEKKYKIREVADKATQAENVNQLAPMNIRPGVAPIHRRGSAPMDVDSSSSSGPVKSFLKRHQRRKAVNYRDPGSTNSTRSTESYRDI